MSQEQKRAAAERALEYVRPGEVLGVGSGSTVRAFIEILGQRMAGQVPRAVSSSRETTVLLDDIGIEVVDLNEVEGYPVYIDGADEFDPALNLIKGGGAALTGEKITVSIAKQFVCVVDASKRVDVLGAFPLPVEVIPMARQQVARRLAELGGDAVLRPGTVTDHGNQILDVHGLRITDPLGLEMELDATPGVVTSGVFARHRADVVLMATIHGVECFE